MSCPNCSCQHCKLEREADRTERYRQWDLLPKCEACNGTGQVEDVCGHYVAIVKCCYCSGTGKQGMGRR
jgi:hypothetical protein